MTPQRPKFIDPKDLDDALVEVSQFQNLQTDKIAVVGGVAMMVYGSGRMTKNLDVAAFQSWDLIENLRDTRELDIGGFAGTTRHGHRVSVILHQGDYSDLYYEAIEKSQTVSGIPVRVVTPDYLAVLKMAAPRPKDREDLRALLRLDVLDLDRVRQIVRRHLGVYAVHELDAFVAECEWRRVREGNDE